MRDAISQPLPFAASVTGPHLDAAPDQITVIAGDTPSTNGHNPDLAQVEEVARPNGAGGSVARACQNQPVTESPAIEPHEEAPGAQDLTVTQEVSAEESPRAQR